MRNYEINIVKNGLKFTPFFVLIDLIKFWT